MVELPIDDIDAALSLLPPSEARAMRDAVVGGRDASVPAPWADFDRQGRFLGGGVSDLLRGATRIVSASQQEPAVAALAAAAREPGFGPGRIVPVADHSSFAWFVPLRESERSRAGDSRLRGFLVDETVFTTVLLDLEPSFGLTAPEFRVLFQIVSGLSLRAAAERDRLSFETKRAHVKSACQKMACDGQKDAVRTLMGLLTHLISVSTGETPWARRAAAFVERHLPEADLTAHRLGDGRLLRILSLGRPDGRPIVLVHGIMFPIVLACLGDALASENLRLLVPLRPGFVDDASVGERDGDLVATGLADIARFISEANLAPAVVAGQSLGGTLALRLASARPGLVSRVVLLSANLMTSASESGAASLRFYEGLRRLRRHPDLYQSVNIHFARYYADRRVCHEILNRLFSGNASDRSVLEGRWSGRDGYAMFSDLYRSSVPAIAADFADASVVKATIGRIRVPITAFHGTDDPLTDLGSLEALLAEASTSRIVALDGGHFVVAARAREVCAQLSSLLDGAEI